MINVQTFQISLHMHPYRNCTILQRERLRQTINRLFFLLEWTALLGNVLEFSQNSWKLLKRWHKSPLKYLMSMQQKQTEKLKNRQRNPLKSAVLKVQSLDARGDPLAHRVTSVVNVTRLHQIITHDMQSGNLRVFVCLFILLIIASLLQCLPTQTCRLTGQPPPWGNETVNKCGDNAVLKSVPRTIIWMLCSILGNPSTTALYK